MYQVNQTTEDVIDELVNGYVHPDLQEDTEKKGQVTHDIKEYLIFVHKQLISNGGEFSGDLRDAFEKHISLDVINNLNNTYLELSLDGLE